MYPLQGTRLKYLYVSQNDVFIKLLILPSKVRCLF